MIRPTRDMSDRHEGAVAEALGGRLTRGSGCTAQDATDVVNKPEDEFTWAADGKSTLSQSISLNVTDWKKLAEQSDGRMPLMPLRTYGDGRLSYSTMDVVAVGLDDMAELMEWARQGKRAERVFRVELDALRWGSPEVARGALQRVAEALGVPLPDADEG